MITTLTTKLLKIGCHLMPLLFCLPIMLYASTTKERKDYLAAQQALVGGQLTQFYHLTEKLRDYPLYPYLRHDYISYRLPRIDTKEIVTFLDENPDFPKTKSLRNKWLKVLAQQKKWQLFLTHYETTNDTVIRCYQLQARMYISKDVALLTDIKRVWLVGHSQPNECNIPFKLLQNSHLMDDALIWQRFKLALSENKLGLARYLQKEFSNKQKNWANHWIRMHQKPEKYTREPIYLDTQKTHEILTHGLGRLARENIHQALENWQLLKTRYQFSAQQVAKINYALAIYAARHHHAEGIKMLDQIPMSNLDDEIFEWRLKVALRNQDWDILKKWMASPFPTKKNQLRRQYWYARALQETGDVRAANKIFINLAKERDYYSFLSADQLGHQYQFNHQSLNITDAEIAAVSALPAIQRSYELFKLYPKGYDSRREWIYALKHMNDRQQEAAAVLAVQQHRYDLGFLSLKEAQSFNDLNQRFPLPYRDMLEKYATHHDLDLSLLYGLIRAESAFRESARSPAGALGLMQLLPKTARSVAKKKGVKFKKKQLEQAQYNIVLGTTYLRQILTRFDNNLMLSVAAYNAGPHRVTKWLPKKACIAADMWAEQIPFSETQKYVRRVLYFASIYDWLLNRPVRAINVRLASSTGKKRFVSKDHCREQNIEYH